MDENGKRVIFMPVDDSEHSERAFDWYVKNLHKPGDKLGIIHIHETPALFEEAAAWDRVIEHGESKWKTNFESSLLKSKEVIQKFKNKAKENAVESETFLTTAGVSGPGHAICDLAERKNADGIIMGSRGLNLVRRTLIGSVSEYVVQHAHIPVTVARPRLSEMDGGITKANLYGFTRK